MTFPSTDRFTGKILRQWLTPQIQSGARIIGGREPDNGRVIVVTMSAGAGPSMDGLFDQPGFQITARGAQNNLDDAEAIAYDVDTILLHAPTSFYMAGVYVDFIGRTGGSPQQLPFQDAQSRFVFTCNYYASVSVGL